MGCCNGYDFTPAPDAALDPSQHVNFTFGMVLGVDDFRQEHAYLAGRDERALRETIGHGVITGLAVTLQTGEAGAVEVRVAPGLALTPDGRLVAVRTAQCARLDEWLLGPGRPAVDRSGPASVHVVLRPADVTGTPVPIPGEPCRDESALQADARIADSFTLDLAWQAPAQTEEAALRTFCAWLRRIEVRDDPVEPPSLATFQDRVETQVTAAIAAAAAAFGQPPRSATPTPPAPDADLVIPRAHYAEYLQAAFDVWIRRLRSGAMAHFGPVPEAETAAERGLLLAALDITLAGGALVTPEDPARSVRWLGRAQLVHLRLLQEWLVTHAENDAPREAHYVLGHADPRLPNAQDLYTAFAAAPRRLARIDPVGVDGLLRPATVWPGDETQPPDYYGPAMSAPIPVTDGGTGQNHLPASGQLLVGAPGEETPRRFALGSLVAAAHETGGDSPIATNLRIDSFSRAPDIVLDTVQDIGPEASPSFAELHVDRIVTTSAAQVTEVAASVVGADATGRLVQAPRWNGDEESIGSTITLGYYGPGQEAPVRIADGGTGLAVLPQFGQTLIGDDLGRYTLGRIAGARQGLNVAISLGGNDTLGQSLDLLIDTTQDLHPQSHPTFAALRLRTPAAQTATHGLGWNASTGEVVSQPLGTGAGTPARRVHLFGSIDELAKLFDRLAEFGPGDHVMVYVPGVPMDPVSGQIPGPKVDGQQVIIKTLRRSGSTLLLSGRFDLEKMTLEPGQSVTLVGSLRLEQWLAIARI